jgi:hypothetical protein
MRRIPDDEENPFELRFPFLVEERNDTSGGNKTGGVAFAFHDLMLMLIRFPSIIHFSHIVVDFVIAVSASCFLVLGAQTRLCFP